jgi:hypothetical protein
MLVDERKTGFDLDAIYGAEDGCQGYTGVPVLVHVGFHKTGTTWLQRNILKPKAGKEFVYCYDSTRTHSTFLLPILGSFNTQAALDGFTNDLNRAEDQNIPFIITDEALGGFPFHKKYNREVNATRIKKVFPEAKILITIREQSAVMISMYGEYIKYGFSSSLSDFVWQPSHHSMTPIVDRAFYNYDRALTLYEAIFGEGNVMALPLEWMSRNSEAAVEKIAAFLGAPLSPPDVQLANSRQNQAWTPMATNVARVMNRFVPQDSRWNRNQSWLAQKLAPNALASRVNRWSNALGVKATFDKDREFVRDILGDYYAPSNRRFAERTGYDLAALGYVVGPA